MSYIVELTKGIMQKALLNFAKQNSVKNEDVQIIIYTEDAQEFLPKYRLYKNYAFLKDISFDDILNTDIDFLGREAIATPFVAQALKRLADEMKCAPGDIRVMVISKYHTIPEHLLKKSLTPDEQKQKQGFDQPELWLYKTDKLVRKLNFKTDIFLEN